MNIEKQLMLTVAAGLIVAALSPFIQDKVNEWRMKNTTMKAF